LAPWFPPRFAAAAVEPDRVVDEPVVVLGAVVAAGEAAVVEDGLVEDGLVPVRAPPDDVEPGDDPDDEAAAAWVEAV